MFVSPITIDGRTTNVTLGTRATGITGMSVTSQYLSTNGGVWRLRYTGSGTHTMIIAGNLGSDGQTIGTQRSVTWNGVALRYWRSYDSASAPRDPPVTGVIVPSRASDYSRITYSRSSDNPTFRATGVTFPVTVYIALSYARTTPNSATSDTVMTALLGDANNPSCATPSVCHLAAPNLLSEISRSTPFFV